MAVRLNKKIKSIELCVLRDCVGRGLGGDEGDMDPDLPSNKKKNTRLVVSASFDVVK